MYLMLPLSFWSSSLKNHSKPEKAGEEKILQSFYKLYPLQLYKPMSPFFT